MTESKFVWQTDDVEVTGRGTPNPALVAQLAAEKGVAARLATPLATARRWLVRGRRRSR